MRKSRKRSQYSKKSNMVTKQSDVNIQLPSNICGVKTGLTQMLEQSSSYDLYTKIDDVTGVVIAAARVKPDDELWTIVVLCASVQPRAGNGRELVRAIESDARQNGVKILATTSASPDAIPFWEAMGFIFALTDSGGIKILN